MERRKTEVGQGDRDAEQDINSGKSVQRDGHEEIKRVGIELDEWQKEIVTAEGNLCICSGRQVGKSTAVSIKAADYAVKNPKKFILIVSVTEDQSERFISMILQYLNENHKPYLRVKSRDKPTKGQIKLSNGSTIRCKPIGATGFGVLGYTVDCLIADEAAFMPEAVWNALTPMMLTTGGPIILISTPNISEGFFFNAFTKQELGFRAFHISSEDVANSRPEPQRTKMWAVLNAEKGRMTQSEYARWYLAIFQDQFKQYYPYSVIAECPKTKREPLSSRSDYYLGVDIARFGGDETTFEIFKKLSNDHIIQVENIAKDNTSTVWTTEQILNLNRIYDFVKIYVDTGGVGAGVFDNLLEIEEVRRKAVDMNAAKKSVEYGEDARARRILKDDMHANLLRLMEQKKITILDDDKLLLSLKSVLYEVDEQTKKRKIYGRYTHIAEGMVRGAWCAKEKNIKVWIDAI